MARQHTSVIPDAQRYPGREADDTNIIFQYYTQRSRSPEEYQCLNKHVQYQSFLVENASFQILDLARK